MPPAIVGPAELIAPPCAGTLCTVGKSFAVSNSQTGLPSAVERACRRPSEPPTKATPEIAEVAAELFTRVPGLARGVNQTRSSAAPPQTMPPKRANNALLPVALGSLGATLVFQTTAPFLSGSRAITLPS